MASQPDSSVGVSGGQPFRFDRGVRVLEHGGVTVDLDRASAEILAFLLDHRGEVMGKESLLAVAWPGRIVSDNSLNKAIGRLRTALRDDEQRYLRTVHGYGYRLAADVPIAPMSADRPEPATDTALRDRSTEAEPSDRPPSLLKRRRWIAALALAALAAAASIAAFAPWTPAARVPPASSIAVLPFAHLGQNRDEDYFSDGLAEELIVQLSRLPQLRVAGRTSAFAWRDKGADVRTIGTSLNVATVLEGSVRKSGDRLRVTVQLVGVANGYQLWSQMYDRPVSELFAMQDEIARAVVAALRIELLPEQIKGLARHQTNNAEAFREWLLARDIFKDDETAHRRAIEHYERAVRLDPDFIDAWIDLADLLGFSGLYADSADEALEGKRRALSILDRVIEKAPDRVDAWLKRGAYKYAHWWDWAGAERDFDEAARRGSRDHSMYLLEMGRLRAALGRLPEAITFEQRATEVDPTGGAWTVMGYHQLSLGQYDAARHALQQALRNVPLDEHAHYYLGLIELLQGNATAALPHFNDSAHVLRLTGQAIAHHSLGDAAAAQRDVDLLASRYGHVLPCNVAEAYAWLDDKDKAFEWLNRAYELRDASFMYLTFNPLLRNLRGDPRFDELLGKVNLLNVPKT